MEKRYKYVDIFKKIDDILTYSSVSEGMTKKERKKYNKSNNTLILDKKNYPNFNNNYAIYYTDLNTLIIDEKVFKNDDIIIDKCTAKNMYVNNYENLGGITIPYELIEKNNTKIKFSWNKVNDSIIPDRSVNIKSKIETINIVYSDHKFLSITENNIEIVKIYYEDDYLIVKIENFNSLVEYKIDKTMNIEKKLIAYEITEKDIQNDILDLRDFADYENILLYKVKKVNKLIINKELIKKLTKYKDLFNEISINELEIIDDSEMKLIPTSINIPITSEIKKKVCKNEFYDNYILISNDDEIKIIYIDKLDNIKIIDKKYFLNDENVENVKIVYEKLTYKKNTNFLILIKYKTGKYKVLIEDKEYVITDSFKKFILLNKNIYINVKEENDIQSNNWFEVFGKNNFKYSGFEEKYNDYLKYKERLEQLKKLGLSYNALLYMYDRKINSIINTETEEGLVNLDDINKFEIDLFNKMGEEYIKVKRLKK